MILGSIGEAVGTSWLLAPDGSPRCGIAFVLNDATPNQRALAALFSVPPRLPEDENGRRYAARIIALLKEAYGAEPGGRP
jgi:hypothetical protein